MNKHINLTLIILLIFIAQSLLAYNFYLTDKDFELIEQNYPYYKWASSICDIPIEMLIAVHYRESHLKRTKNIGGAFMLDCGGDGTPDFDLNIRQEEQKIASIYGYALDASISNDFAFACLVAAHYIKSKARYDLNTEHGVADAFWGYNGRAYSSYLKSAYVCSDPKNGNVMYYYYKGKKRIDVNPGCLVIWHELMLKNWKKIEREALK
jgi:hypothetical protein